MTAYQPTDATRTVEFVRRQRHRINLQLTKVNVHLANSLNCIAMNDRARRFGQFGNLPNRLNHTCLVVR